MYAAVINDAVLRDGKAVYTVALTDLTAEPPASVAGIEYIYPGRVYNSTANTLLLAHIAREMLMRGASPTLLGNHLAQVDFDFIQEVCAITSEQLMCDITKVRAMYRPPDGSPAVTKPIWEVDRKPSVPSPTDPNTLVMLDWPVAAAKLNEAVLGGGLKNRIEMKTRWVPGVFEVKPLNDTARSFMWNGDRENLPPVRSLEPTCWTIADWARLLNTEHLRHIRLAVNDTASANLLVKSPLEDFIEREKDLVREATIEAYGQDGQLVVRDLDYFSSVTFGTKVQRLAEQDRINGFKLELLSASTYFTLPSQLHVLQSLGVTDLHIKDDLELTRYAKCKKAHGMSLPFLHWHDSPMIRDTSLIDEFASDLRDLDLLGTYYGLLWHSNEEDVPARDPFFNLLILNTKVRVALDNYPAVEQKTIELLKGKFQPGILDTDMANAKSHFVLRLFKRHPELGQAPAPWGLRTWKGVLGGACTQLPGPRQEDDQREPLRYLPAFGSRQWRHQYGGHRFPTTEYIGISQNGSIRDNKQTLPLFSYYGGTVPIMGVLEPQGFESILRYGNSGKTLALALQIDDGNMLGLAPFLNQALLVDGEGCS